MYPREFAPVRHTLWRRHGVGTATLTTLSLLICFSAPIVGTATAQIVDPCFSEVQVVCPENSLLVTPGGNGDPLGDLGIVVTCRDGAGVPIPGIPPEAFELLPGDPGQSTLNVWAGAVLADSPTDANGTILLTNVIEAGGYVLGGGLLVRVNGIVLDCQPLNDIQVRSPDITGDGMVNISDFSAFADCFPPGPYCPRSDFDTDGAVGLTDLVIFQRHFGEEFPPGPKLKLRAATVRPAAWKQAPSELFNGCLQRDFDEGDGPAFVRESITVAPSVPFSLKILVKDFDALTGVEFDLSLPAGVRLALGGCVQAVSPFALPPGFSAPCGATSVPTIQLALSGNLCVTTGPVFVAEILLQSDFPQTLDVNQFAISGKLTDCDARPNEFTACVGTPTPCEVSSLDVVPGIFLMCPGGDLTTSETVTLVLRDQDGNGVPGVPIEDLRVTLYDEMGGILGDTFEMIPLASETDPAGELPFSLQPRESCRWDRCLDLRITATLGGCELTAFKRVRSLNLVRYEDDPFAAGFDIIDQSDVDTLLAGLYALNPCLDFFQTGRCGVATAQAVVLMQAHLGHSCSVVGIGDLPALSKLELRQNVPNPFNPVTVLEVRSPRDLPSARLDIFTLGGRHVRSLWEGTVTAPSRSFTWDGTDGHGLSVASGVYVARLVAAEEETSVRMVLLR